MHELLPAREIVYHQSERQTTNDVPNRDCIYKNSLFPLSLEHISYSNMETAPAVYFARAVFI